MRMHNLMLTETRKNKSYDVAGSMMKASDMLYEMGKTV